MQKLITLLALTLASPLFSQAQEADYLIKNANVVAMKEGKIIKNATLIIKDGKILEITLKNSKKAKQTIDAKGKYLLPSLADAHVHLPDTEVEMERVLKLNLVNGVTKLRSMRGDWKHTQWKEKWNTKNSYYPKLYLSPPPITRNTEATLAELENYVKAAKENGFDFVKILSIKNQAFFVQLDSLCKKYNMPLGGHFLSNPKGVVINDEVFFNSNYTSIEHLGGLVGEHDTFKKRLNAIKEKNIFICPTLSWYSVGSGRYSYDELRSQLGMEFVPVATVNEWIAKTKAYREKLGTDAYKEEVANELKSLDEKYRVVKELHNLGVQMLLSPDASSKYMMAGFGVVGEMELLQNAQLSNFEILKMATTNFSRFFKGNYGILEAGKDADFIFVDENPLENIQTLTKIKGLFYNNNYLTAEDLDKMKTQLLSETKN